MIAFLMIAGLGVLALLSRLAALTRMTIPLLYTVSMLTVFHGWYTPIPCWQTASCSPL